MARRGLFKLASVMKSRDFFALPSRLEGTPRPITGAMACGLPMVSIRVGGIPEQVARGESGLLVPLDEPPALIDALRTLLTDEGLRARMGSEGRARRCSPSRSCWPRPTAYRDLMR